MKVWLNRMGTLVVCMAAWLLVATPPAVLSQSAGNTASGERVQLISTLLPNGTQQIVVLDNTERSLAVYHIEPMHGKIQLKSVRRLLYDLRMEQFNAETPLPSELREVQPPPA